MFPHIPYTFGWQWDVVLTKFFLDGFGQPNLAMGPIAQTRNDGLVFTRKGFIHPKTQFGLEGPPANSFETLAARNGSFMSVGTINDDVPPQISQCQISQWPRPACDQAYTHFKEWAHFILSTQLSTYPVF
jgi:hypothetical protein